MALYPNWSQCPSGLNVGELGDYDYVEADGSGESGISVGSAQTSRIFYTKWSRFPFFLDDLLGYAYLASSSLSPTFGCGSSASVYQINRILPDEHPLITPFYALEATVKGHGINGSSSDFINYKYAEITAVYKSPTYDILPDNVVAGNELRRYITRSQGFGVESMNLDNGSIWKWVAGNRQVKSITNKLQGSMELNYTWHEIPAYTVDPFVVPTIAAIQNCLGKVNCVDFDGYPPETVLFLGVDPKPETPKLSAENGVDPQYYWTITYKFAVKNNGPSPVGSGNYAGWNHIYDPLNFRYDQITSGPSAGKPTCGDTPNPPCLGYGLYQFCDMNSLFFIPV